MLKDIAKRLKIRYKDDKSFQLEYDELQTIHLNRMKGLFKEEEMSVLDEISLVFQRQYAQGILLVESFKLANDEEELINEAITFIEVMNNYPTHLFTVFKESNQDIYYVDTAHGLAMDILASKGTRVFEVFKASCADITNVAIANTIAEMYPIYVRKERIQSFKNTVRPMMLNSQYFISPFIQQGDSGSHIMQYDLFTYHTPQKPMSWVGRVMCQPYATENHTMDIFLSDMIDSNEKQSLVTQFARLLQSDQPINLNLYNVSTNTTMKYIPEEQKETFTTQ